MLKSYFKITIRILVSLLILWSAASYITLERQRKEISRLETNLEQYNQKVSNLTLRTKELNTELAKKNTAVLELDSILKKRNKKIKQLEEYNRTIVVIRDTVKVEAQKEIESLDSVNYKINFKDFNDCISVAGHVMTTDSSSTVFVTEKECNVKVWDIRTKRKWYEFWKPKYEHEVISECGEVEKIVIDKK